MDKIGGVKFVFAMFVVALAFVLTVLGKIDGQTFLNTALGVGATFVIGNITNQISSDSVKKTIANTQTTPTNPPISI